MIDLMNTTSFLSPVSFSPGPRPPQCILDHFEKTETQTKVAFNLHRHVSEHEEAAICDLESVLRETFGMGHTAGDAWHGTGLACVVNVLQSMQRRH